MRAFVLTEFGATAEVADLDIPEPADGEVRVHAASVNGFDLSVAGGYLKGMMEQRLPASWARTSPVSQTRSAPG